MPAARIRGRGEQPRAVSRDDAYVWLLGISLAAMVIGCILLFLDWDPYQGKAPPTVQPAVPRGSGVPAVPPAGPGGQPPQEKPPEPPPDKGGDKPQA